MTDHTPEFLSQYKNAYGPGGALGAKAPNFLQCAAVIYPPERGGFFHIHQCAYKNGHGPYGAWCKRHDPDAALAKKRAEEEAYEERRKRARLIISLTEERLEIIKCIASGHDDPKSLCADYLHRLAEADQ